MRASLLRRFWKAWSFLMVCLWFSVASAVVLSFRPLKRFSAKLFCGSDSPNCLHWELRLQRCSRFPLSSSLKKVCAPRAPRLRIWMFVDKSSARLTLRYEQHSSGSRNGYCSESSLSAAGLVLNTNPVSHSLHTKHAFFRVISKISVQGQKVNAESWSTERRDAKWFSLNKFRIAVLICTRLCLILSALWFYEMMHVCLECTGSCFE